MNIGLNVLLWTLILLVNSSSVWAIDSLVISGSGDSQKILRKLGKVFEADNPGIFVNVPNSIGSTGGIKALLKGKCSLARTARLLKENERKEGLRQVVFAHSPVVFAGNLPRNSVQNLTSSQVVEIFSGKIPNWVEVDARINHKIYIVMREAGDSSRRVIKEEMPAFSRIENFAGKIVYSTPEAVSILNETPFTIGFVPKVMLLHSSLTIFSIDSIKPTIANSRSGKYSFVVPLAIVWKGELGKEAKRFVDFVLSPSAAEVILSFGGIPCSSF